MKIEITNDLKYLRFVYDEVSKFCQENSIDKNFEYKLNLIIEEYLTNIIYHGSIDEVEHKLEINLIKQQNEIKVKILDDATEFNILEADLPDLEKKMNNREPGGLGILLILQNADEKKYYRKNKLNNFEFTIKLDN